MRRVGTSGSAGSDEISAQDRHARTIEIVSAVLLAFAAVATAWCSYQSTRWHGVQANAYSSASARRVESTRASTEAGQLRQIDITLFTQWLDAFAEERSELATFYRERFRDEFQPAFEAWVATRPRVNPDAPKSPFAMPEYKLAAEAQATNLDAEAEAFSAQARSANQRADNYVLGVVLFALALFFTGVSTGRFFRSNRVRLALLGVAVVVFVGAAAWVGTFPVNFSV
jgi:hypothetical protein